MADRNGYIGRAPGDSSVVVARQTFSPTGIQTDFTFASGYVVGYLDLYLNGARLIEGQDFTATDGSVVGLTTYAQNGDVLELVAYKAFNATNVQSAGGDFSVGGNLSVTGNTELTGTLTVGGVEVQPGAAGTWASYDSNTGISTTKKVKVDNDFEVTGVSTFSSDVSIADKIIHTGDTNTAIRFPAADTFTVETGGTERLRVGSAGTVSIGPIDSSSVATLSAAGSNTDLRLRAVGTGGWFEIETNSASRLRISSAGLVGIGTENAGTKLDVRGGDWANGDIVVGEKDNAGRIKFARGADGSDSGSIGFAAADSNSVLSMNVASGDGTLTFQTNSTERLRIDSSGNVGINTTTPTENLSVNGNVVFGHDQPAGNPGSTIGVATVRGHHVNSDADYAELYFANSTSSGGSTASIRAGRSGDNAGTNLTFYTQQFGGSNGNGTERLRIDQNGNVKIGSGAPAQSLHVTDSTPYEGILINGSGAPRVTFARSSNTTVEWGVGIDGTDGNKFAIAQEGNTAKLIMDVGGNVNITGVGTAIQWDATSDVALKENIEVIDNPIVKLSQLKGVTFDWKFGGHSVGVIAQDVEKVLPTAVGGSKDQKTVNYNAIIGLLVESVKDQQKQIEELKSLLDK